MFLPQKGAHLRSSYASPKTVFLEENKMLPGELSQGLCIQVQKTKANARIKVRRVWFKKPDHKHQKHSKRDTHLYRMIARV